MQRLLLSTVSGVIRFWTSVLVDITRNAKYLLRTHKEPLILSRFLRA
jgi:hypothetical protein